MHKAALIGLDLPLSTSTLSTPEGTVMDAAEPLLVFPPATVTFSRPTPELAALNRFIQSEYRPVKSPEMDVKD